MIDFEKDSGTDATTDDLQEIGSLSKQLVRLKMRVLYHVAVTKSIAEDITRLEKTDIPTIMKRCKLKKFTLDNGVVVECKDDLSASISKVNEPNAFKWLEENGHGSLIKTKEEIFFDRKDEELRIEFEKIINKTKFKNLMSKKCSVHAATLKAFFKTYIEEKGEVNDKIKKLFGIFQYGTTKLKIPKDVEL